MCPPALTGNQPRAILMNGMHIHSFLNDDARVVSSTDPTYAKMFRANCRFLHKFTDLEIYSSRKEITPGHALLEKIRREG